MSYSPKLSSAFNDTVNRSTHISPLSGMCSLCTEECSGTCEIALAAVLGMQTVYPTNTGANQVASEKDYPFDWSHFNINGRVFGAQGVNATHEDATVFNVKLEREYGYTHKVKMTMPIILPALIKMNWVDYFGGAAMAGISCVIGEDARNKDPEFKLENGKVAQFPALQTMLDAFRKYDRGYGQIILQVNTEDDSMGIPEYAIQKCGATAIEYKFGQSAKGTQPVTKLKNHQEALAKVAVGMLVTPDPTTPEILEKVQQGIAPNFYVHARLPQWTEEYFVKRFDQLRALGANNIYLKMAGYDPSNIEKVLQIGSAAKVDMITFDGAGGGSGYSPNKMMNEWGLPTILLEQVVCEMVARMKSAGQWVPAITMTGGFASEDQVFKALAYGENNVTAIGLCRAAMAAAMMGKNIGDRIKAGEIPKRYQKYGNTVEEIFTDLADLRSIYGKAANDFSPGAIGVFSYLNKIAFGIKHFGALNRKFDVALWNRSDLIPLTEHAKDAMQK